MQLTEILLKNSSASVFSEKTDKFSARESVVVDISGCLELGIIKGEAKSDEATNLVEIVRSATSADIKTNCENCRYAKTLLPEIKKIANEQNLDMKIGLITVSLDKSKITVNYTAEERVDFRDLVKILASKYKAKIEMKQIGNRDETKAIGAIGMCGRVCCCKAFLSDFDKVSIKMAKNQNIALNPSKINGMCGRLLCCLKYEDDYYAEMQQIMPKLNSFIVTPDGKGQVTATDFLRKTVTVTFTKEEDSTEVKTYSIDDLNLQKKNK